MTCLTERQLARLALGLNVNAELTVHLKECTRCKDRLKAMQSLAHQLIEAHAKFDQGHQQARDRLLTLLPLASQPQEPARPWNQIAHRIGELSMRQRIALGGVGVVAVLAILLVWLGSVATPLSAMEQMAENIRKAKSYKATMFNEVSFPGEPGYKPAKEKITGTVYYLAPGSCRIDYTSRVDFNGGPRPNVKQEAELGKEVKPQLQPDPNVKERLFPIEEDKTQIDFEGKPGISIDHKKKSFIRQPPQQQLSRFPEMLEKLGQFAGQGDRELGIKEIHGRKASGFKIEGKKIDPVNLEGPLEVWIDVESKLPVLLNFSPLNSQVPQTTCMQDFEWNTALDPKLFGATPPEGYSDNTPKLPEPEADLSLDEQVRRITEGLSFFANGPASSVKFKSNGELFGGHYPQDICKENRKGLELSWVDDSGKVKKTRFGIPEIAYILEKNPDSAYNGKTVGPKNKDKVLLRWKLDDGKYEVIFGDLRAKTVTAEELQGLEGK